MTVNSDQPSHFGKLICVGIYKEKEEKKIIGLLNVVQRDPSIMDGLHAQLFISLMNLISSASNEQIILCALSILKLISVNNEKSLQFGVSVMLQLAQNHSFDYQIRSLTLDSMLLLINQMQPQSVYDVIPGTLSAVFKFLNEKNQMFVKSGITIASQLLINASDVINSLKENSEIDEKLSLFYQNINLKVSSPQYLLVAAVEQLLRVSQKLSQLNSTRILMDVLISKVSSISCNQTKEQFQHQIRNDFSCKFVSKRISELLKQFGEVMHSPDDEKRTQFLHKLSGYINLYQDQVYVYEIIDALLYMFTPQQSCVDQGQITFSNFVSSDLKNALDQITLQFSCDELIDDILLAIHSSHSRLSALVIISVLSSSLNQFQLKRSIGEILSIVNLESQVKELQKVCFIESLVKLLSFLDKLVLTFDQVSRLILISLEFDSSSLLESLCNYQGLDFDQESLLMLFNLYSQGIVNQFIFRLKFQQDLQGTLLVLNNWSQLSGSSFKQFAPSLVSIILQRIDDFQDSENIIQCMVFFKNVVKLNTNNPCDSHSSYQQSDKKSHIENWVSLYQNNLDDVDSLDFQNKSSQDQEQNDFGLDDNPLSTFDLMLRDIMNKMVNYVSDDRFLVRVQAIQVCIAGIQCLKIPENVSLMDQWWPFLQMMLSDEQSESVRLACDYMKKFLQHTGNIQAKRFREQIAPLLLQKTWYIQNDNPLTQSFKIAVIALQFLIFLSSQNILSKEQNYQLGCLYYQNQNMNEVKVLDNVIKPNVLLYVKLSLS